LVDKAMSSQMETVIPSLFIRADSTTQIGTGHIMRCIALAQAWQDRGGQVTFLSYCESGALRQRIIDEGFDFIAIDAPNPDPSDLSHTLEILRQLKTQNSKLKTWLVLDGYHFTPDYQKTIRDVGIRLLVIDDMNHLSYYHTDILLNQNIHAPDLKYKCDADTTMLLGTSYALLRREFLKYRGFKRQTPDRVKNILVTLGGGDPDNVTLKVIQALNLIGNPDIEVKIVVGPANKNIDSLQKELSFSPFPFSILQDVDNMHELMAWADLAISAGGSTCWELAFMGLPSLVVILAENQVKLAEHLKTQQAAVNIGWCNMFSVEQLSAKINVLICDKNLRKFISENASSLVDGEGASRATKIMIGSHITLRWVTYDDCNLIWQWSNEEETRKVSFSQGLISWDEHTRWFKEKLADPNHLFFIATNGNKNPLGQIRYSVEGKNATVSFSIAQEYRNLGYGSKVLRVAALKLFYETEVEDILAFVKADNSVSFKTFQNAGFKKIEELSLHGTKSFKFVLIKTELT
jgi:UDP-2,4-diacetamido-2,4,6-trideoxy-beta-L-altropyranose hydrolase